MKKTITLLSALLLSVSGISQTLTPVVIPELYRAKVDSVLSLMTLEEKVGQLNQYTGNKAATGPEKENPHKMEHIKSGKVGSMLNVLGAKKTREVQELAMQSRLGIPLIFGFDVIHGMRTIFPIPLAEAASFNLDLMRRTAEGAALEASAQGLHWTFAPMVDISRDARWGRVTEGAGEDTWYGSKVAAARVKGFQGESLSDKSTIMACLKHFAAYGAVIGGKEYNSVDMSRLTFHDTYMPPYKAAVEAGAASVMNAFNDFDGIPATGNQYLQRTLLKGEWGFNGLTVSDWGSVGEMVMHGYSPNNRAAAKAAILAGCDIDMESVCYLKTIEKLVTSGEVDIKYIDDAVRRILLKKFELGLFDDPFKYSNVEYEKEITLCSALRDLSREAGRESIVLLKNNNNTLPLTNKAQKIAVIGSLAASQKDMLGSWAGQGVANEVVAPLEGIKNRFTKSTIVYDEGYNIQSNKFIDIDKTLSVAEQSDVVIVAVGERFNQSGEAHSRTDISINSNHQELVKLLKTKCKNVVVLLMGGRPMIFNDMEPSSDAILLTWWLGTEAGNAIADVLSGSYNPSGKLPMTFPQNVGQIPLYYNYKSTGRPQTSRKDKYVSAYDDVSNDAAYEFGYGLSYSNFEIDAPTIEKTTFGMDETIVVSVNIKNSSNITGIETLQLYIQDKFASVTTPVKNLRGFKRVELKGGESKNIKFELTSHDLGYVNSDLKYVTDAGEFKIMAGSSSEKVKDVTLFLK